MNARIELEMKSIGPYHACMHIFSYFEFNFQEFPHARLEFTLIFGNHQVSCCVIACDHVLRSLSSKKFMHVMFMAYS